MVLEIKPQFQVWDFCLERLLISIFLNFSKWTLQMFPPPGWLGWYSFYQRLKLASCWKTQALPSYSITLISSWYLLFWNKLVVRTLVQNIEPWWWLIVHLWFPTRTKRTKPLSPFNPYKKFGYNLGVLKVSVRHIVKKLLVTVFLGRAQH